MGYVVSEGKKRWKWVIRPREKDLRKKWWRPPSDSITFILFCNFFLKSNLCCSSMKKEGGLKARRTDSYYFYMPTGGDHKQQKIFCARISLLIFCVAAAPAKICFSLFPVQNILLSGFERRRFWTDWDKSAILRLVPPIKDLNSRIRHVQGVDEKSLHFDDGDSHDSCLGRIARFTQRFSKTPYMERQKFWSMVQEFYCWSVSFMSWNWKLSLKLICKI